MLELSKLSDREQVELVKLTELQVGVLSPFVSEWDFCIRGVITKDESVGELRPFPAHDYLRYVIEERNRSKADSVPFVLDKSRRMLVTWLMLSLYLYDTLTCSNLAYFIGSRKLESSAYLLGPERLFGIWDRIPDAVWPGKPALECTGKHGMGYTVVSCAATGSYIQAIASGADQLRQFTATNVFLDEFAFFDNARETWGAVQPTVLGGGHLDVASTPNLGSFMSDLIEGRG